MKVFINEFIDWNWFTWKTMASPLTLSISSSLAFSFKHFEKIYRQGEKIISQSQCDESWSSGQGRGLKNNTVGYGLKTFKCSSYFSWVKACHQFIGTYTLFALFVRHIKSSLERIKANSIFWAKYLNCCKVILDHDDHSRTDEDNSDQNSDSQNLNKQTNN